MGFSLPTLWLCCSAVSAAVTLDDPLTGLAETWRPTGDWVGLETATWRPVAGGLEGGDGQGFLLLDASPQLSSGTIEVTLTPRERQREGGWAVAALCLYESPQRRWQLALVEDPDGRTHRTELIEQHDGVWQAQGQGATRLTGRQEGPGDWQWGRPYRFQIEWSAEAITGRVGPLGAEPVWSCRYEFPPDTPAVRVGRPALMVGGLRAVFRDLALRGETDESRVAVGRGAVLLDGPGPWADEAWQASAAAMGDWLREAGYEVEPVAPERLHEALDRSRHGLVACPSLQRLPVATMQAVAEFVAAGGDLLASGGEPFAEPLYPAGETWVNRTTLLEQVTDGRVVFEPATTRGLARATNQPEPAPTIRYGVAGPTGEANALQVTVPALAGWDTLSPPPFDASPFGENDSLTLVWVKGTKGQWITVEWTERDGSRWIARVPLAPDWRRHVLEPRDFRFWSNGSPPERAGTVFHPADARRLSFGPAIGFGATRGACEYTIGPLAVAPSPAADAAFDPPTIETISPWYKQYDEVRDGVRVRVPIARARGLTAAPELEGRYSVIGPLTAPVATRYLAAGGSIVFWLPSVRLSDAERSELLEVLRRSAFGCGLLNGGAGEFTALVGEPVAVAARVINAAAAGLEARVEWSVRQGDDTVRQAEREVTVLPQGRRAVEGPALEPLSPGMYRVVTTLRVGEDVRDRIESDLRVMDPAAAREGNRRVRVVDGHFAVAGRRVFLHGVNYWPRYVSGQEIGRYWSHWTSPANYDPELVEADLTELERLGMNLVSISCFGVNHARVLMDFLERCRAHGLWVNLYIGAASGLEFRPREMEEFFNAAHLAGNDTLFAYDLAWEPRIGRYAERKRFDPEWREWLAEQYGSLGNATAAWSMNPPVDEQGEPTAPSDEQVTQDGPHRVMVAAYRRFCDDLISRRYGKVIRHLRRLDPDTLMGVRTGYGGTGQSGVNLQMPYDLASGAAHLDFLSPEGYGLPPSFEEARRTGLITAYARLVGGGKPVFWCEFGASIGPRGGDEHSVEHQRKIWETMLRVVADSGADATAGWWWPGGWRLNEQSDYGVLDPSGAPRPAAVIAAELGRRLQSDFPSPGEEPAVTLTVDRDLDARGISALWDRHAEAYVAARSNGQAVRLITPGTDTNTATMPRVQVGNVPYRGNGPLKYANAEVAGIEIRWLGGNVRFENGGSATFPPDTPLEVYVTMINTGEATWLPANAEQGGCRLRFDGVDVPVPLSVPRFGAVVLGPLLASSGAGGFRLKGRLAVDGVGPFGETVRLAVDTKL